MTIAPIGFVSRAYKAFAPKGVQGLVAKPEGVAQGGHRNFGLMIRDIVQTSSANLRQAEAVSLAAMEGKASTQAMVEAVMQAETTLTAVINVRDRMVQAYQDVMRMAI